MIARFLRAVRMMAAGRRLTRAIERNEQASKELDTVLEEVLKQ